MEILKIRKIHPDAIVPAKATSGAACFDLYVILDSPFVLMPHERNLFHTGLSIEMPSEDCVCLLFSRSGMGIKHGISLSNSVGVIDSDYRGELCVAQAEAAEASVQAAAFCRQHGENARNSTLISLCVEEMVNNIVTHGFKKERKDQCVEVRILFKDGSRIIRIRDNCVNFDPVNYLQLHASDDPAAHIGIRMVMKMVKSADYVNSLGLNNLTLVL